MFKVTKINFISYAVYFQETDFIGNLGEHDTILMQYTSLKDTNGKEIYEGDVVKNQQGILAEIYFNNGAFCMFYQSDWGKIKKENLNPLQHFIHTNVKIIGNIYENPEILERIRF